MNLEEFEKIENGIEIKELLRKQQIEFNQDEELQAAIKYDRETKARENQIKIQNFIEIFPMLNNMSWSFIEEFYNSWKSSLERVLPDEWYIPNDGPGLRLAFNRKENLTIEEEKKYLTKPETYRYLHDYFKYKLSKSSNSLGEKAKLIHAYIVQQDEKEFDPFNIEKEELNEFADQLNEQVLNTCVKEIESYNSIKNNLEILYRNLSEKSIECLAASEYFYRFYDYQHIDPSFCAMNYGRAFEIELTYFVKRSGGNISKINTLDKLKNEIGKGSVPYIKDEKITLYSVTEKIKHIRNKAAHEEGNKFEELEKMRKILLEDNWLEKVAQASR